MTLTQRRRESDQVAFQEIERPAIDARLDRLTTVAEQLERAANVQAAAAKRIDSVFTKLVVVVIAFVLLWGVEVLCGIQTLIQRGLR